MKIAEPEATHHFLPEVAPGKIRLGRAVTVLELASPDIQDISEDATMSRLSLSNFGEPSPCVRWPLA